MSKIVVYKDYSLPQSLSDLKLYKRDPVKKW